MKDIRPYIINAHIQWLDDSGARPHLVIENGPDVKVPPHLQSQPTISFLVKAESVEWFLLNDEGVSFTARFNGKPFTVFAPLENLAAIIANNGEIQIPLKRSAALETEEPTPEPEVQLPKAEVAEELEVPKIRPELRVVKGGASGDGIPKAVLSVVK